MTSHQTILLIGTEPAGVKNLALRLRQVGYSVLTASDGREGFRLTRLESPDLIISETDLPGLSAAEFCRMIREDRELWATPLMILSETNREAIEVLRAGADDCLTLTSDTQLLTAKIEWLIERKTSENRLFQYYKILRRRQAHITRIIKGTAELFTVSEIEHKTAAPEETYSREFEKNINQKIELGMNMVGALANLLEEQVNAIETWEDTRRGENAVARRTFDSAKAAINYQSVFYDPVDENSPSN
jgi:DNA-binding response OmpR family regulator